MLPRPPGGLRAWLIRHPRVVDGVTVGFFAAFAGLSLLATAGLDRTPRWDLPYADWWLIPTGAVIVIASVLLARRRAHPAALTVGGVALLVLPLPVPSIGESVLVLFGLYALGAYRSSRAAWGAFAAASVGAAITASTSLWMPPVDAMATPALVGTGLAMTLLVLLAATLAGSSVGNHRRYVAALVDRAAQLTRERDQEATIAAARERGRIAAEMHDVIAHSVSVMISLSEGAAATRDERDSREAMRDVAETGRRTLGELRRLLGMLHDDDDVSALAPQPGAGQLASLFDGFRAAGMRLQSDVDGVADPDEALGLTVYRIAQESLTNALRYAGGAVVRATVTWTPGRVRIRVEDDGVGPAPASAGSGRGLVGIRARAALYDGTVEAGPRAGGGWSVVVTLRFEEGTR